MHGLPPNQFHVKHVRELGVGGLGRVDEVEVVSSNAYDKPVGSRWARKRLNEAFAENAIARQRFDREITVLKSMSHPNIITFEGSSLPGDERCYVMPVFADSLRKLIARNSKRGDWRFAANQGAVLAGALAYAHELGFFHRDLKPDNLLFNPQGPLTITDWGIGYFVHRESKVLTPLTRGGMGTEYYCSLEQWSTGKCDQRGDIYSLGMTLDELVTGQQRKITAGQGLAGTSAPEASTGARTLQGLLIRMTSLFASGRPHDMATVSAELAAIAKL